MPGFGKPRQVTEEEAKGEIEHVYQEIRQTLRVTGTDLNCRLPTYAQTRLASRRFKRWLKKFLFLSHIRNR
jgi:hypothetical protein